MEHTFKSHKGVVLELTFNCIVDNNVPSIGFYLIYCTAWSVFCSYCFIFSSTLFFWYAHHSIIHTISRNYRKYTKIYEFLQIYTKINFLYENLRISARKSTKIYEFSGNSIRISTNFCKKSTKINEFSTFILDDPWNSWFNHRN